MPSPATSQPTLAVVYHPLKGDLSRLRAAVARHQKRAGWAPSRWYQTAEQDAGVGAARQAVDEGARVVLSCGGDGTIRAVAEVLRGTGVPMAIVPHGTGNLLARNLGAPLGNIDETVRAAFAGRTRPIDLGVITLTRPDGSADEHVFLVLAGMGLDARAITATSSAMKKRLGWLAYVDAGVRVLLSEGPFTIRYAVDAGAAQTLTAYTVMIGNCGLLPGGVLLIPDAQIDDGMLDVVALRPLGPFTWLRIWHKIGWENGVLRKTRAGRKMIDVVHDTRSVSYLRARSYTFSTPKPQAVQLDGDDFGVAQAVNGTVDAGSLLVCVLDTWQIPAVSASTVAGHRRRE